MCKIGEEQLLLHVCLIGDCFFALVGLTINVITLTLTDEYL